MGILINNNGNDSGVSESITIDNAQTTIDLGIKKSNGVFTVELDIESGEFGNIDSERSTNFTARGYASLDGKTVYSEYTKFGYKSAVKVSFSTSTSTSTSNPVTGGVDRA